MLEKTGIDWRERRLISILCIDQSVKLKLYQGEAISVNTVRGIRKGCCLSAIISNVDSK